MTNSMEWVTHNRGHSVQLVRKREKERWEWLFKGKRIGFIIRKLSKLLPLDRKAVLTPTGAETLIVDPYDPIAMASAIREALQRLGSTYDIVLTREAESRYGDTLSPSDDNASSAQRPSIDPTDRIGLTQKDKECLLMLFGKRNLGYIERQLNILWLPDDVKINFPSVWQEIIVIDRKDHADMVRQAKELLAAAGSTYDIDLVIKDGKSTFPRMAVVA